MVQWKDLLRLQKSVKDVEDDTEADEQNGENRLDAGHCHRPSYGHSTHGHSHNYGHSPGMVFSAGHGYSPGMVLAPGYGHSPYTYSPTSYTYSPMAICGRCGYSTTSCICRQVVTAVQPQQVVTAVQPQQVVTAVQPQQVVTAVQPQPVVTSVQPQQVVIKADPVQVPLKPRASSPVVVSVKDVAKLKTMESDEDLSPVYSVKSKPSYTIVESGTPVHNERVVVSTPQAANGYGQQQNVYNRRRRSFCGCCTETFFETAAIIQKSAEENEDDTENNSRDEENRLAAGFDICFDPCYDPCYTPCYDPCYTPSYDPCYSYGYGYGYSPYVYNQRAYTPIVNTPIVMCGGCGYSTANCVCARVKVVPAPQVVTVAKPQKAIKTAPKKVGTNVKKPADAQQAVKETRSSSTSGISVKVSESTESQIPARSVGTSIESGTPAQNAQPSAPQAASGYAPQQQNPNQLQAKAQRRRNCCGCC